MPENYNENQRKIWNKIAEDWSRYRKKQFEDYQKFISNKTGRLLDLGCGSGRNFVKKPDLEIYGIDFSIEMLKYAEEKIKKESINAVLVKSETDKIPFVDNFFDSAIFIAALHCIPDSDKRRNSLRELFRVLKPEAEAMIAVWSRNHEKVKKSLKGSKEVIIPWKKDREEYGRYYYIYDKKELEKLLEEAGFEIIDSRENDNIIVIARKPKN